MVESFYDNFKNKFSSAEVSSKQCPLCFSHYDDQAGLVICPKIRENETINKALQQIRYTDIFKPLEFQIPAIQALEKAFNYRMQLLSNS